MRVVHFLSCSAILLLNAGLVMADNNSTDPPTYNVNRVGELGPPLIDGVVGDGEWDAAAAAAGDWVDLRTHIPDAHNLRFRMLWDDANLFILGETDYDDFPAGPTDTQSNPQFGGGSYNPNFYIDPNTDNEEYFSEGWVVDGYQFAWDVYEGHSERRPTEGIPDEPLHRLMRRAILSTTTLWACFSRRMQIRLLETKACTTWGTTARTAITGMTNIRAS